MKNNTQNMSGFSFVELAMIIAIAGLLFGAISVGRDLIHLSELRNITAQISQYRAAINTFDNKFRGLPGDFRNAEAMGLSDGNCPTEPGCNGNGDRLFDVSEASSENMNFWYHLWKANMFDQTLDGLTPEYGTGLPSTNLRDEVGFYIETYDAIGTLDGNKITLGREIEGINVYLTTFEAYTIDSKADDGKARQGKILAGSHPFQNPCTVIYIPGLDDYNDFDSDTKKCNLFVEF